VSNRSYSPPGLMALAYASMIGRAKIGMMSVEFDDILESVAWCRIVQAIPREPALTGATAFVYSFILYPLSGMMPPKYTMLTTYEARRAPLSPGI
jgi:hypothetical protein